jgi:hypothetical protein
LRNGLIEATAFFAQAARGKRREVHRQHVADIRSARSQESCCAGSLDFRASFRLEPNSIDAYSADVLRRVADLRHAGMAGEDWSDPFPLGNGRHAPIAGEDQGRVVAGLLENPASHAGKIYPLFGPVELNHHEIAKRLTNTLDRPFAYQPMTIPEFQALMEAGPFGSRPTQHICSVAQDYQDGVFASTNDVVEAVTGCKPLTVEEFAESNREKFAV